MQDFFFVGTLCAINLKASNDIIERNVSRNKLAQQQAQQIQKTMSSIENVVDWRMDDPRVVTEDLRQQFLFKTKTRRTPTSDRASPRERVPLATTDFGQDDFDNELIDEVPIYTYNPSIGGTQV